MEDDLGLDKDLALARLDGYYRLGRKHRLQFGTSDNWVEPFGGGRFLFRPSRNWIFGLSADAGGFGIGSASDLT